MTSSPERRRRVWKRAAPGQPPALRRALVIAGALGVFAFAIFAFLALSPTRLDAAASRESVAKAVALLDADNPTAARAEALTAVRSDPNSADAHLVLARAQLQLEDGIGAEAEIRRAVDAGHPGKQVHHLRAHALLIQGHVDKALAEAEKTDPRHRAYGLRIRARALTAKGDFAAAGAAMAEAIRIAPRDADVWTGAGRYRLAIGDVAGAIEAAQQAVRVDPGNIDALVLRGELVRAQYGLVAALPWFERALARDPRYHEALIEYAATLGDTGRTVDMLAATRRALAARPGSPPALYLQAVLAARAGKYDLARSLVEKTGGAMDDMPGMLLLAGTLDLEQGDNEQAIEKLKQLVGNQPTNITARKLLAVAFLRSDASRNAIDMLRPVAARGDADSYTLTLIARGLERIGARGEAARYLDRAAFPERSASEAFSVSDSIATLGAAAQQRPNDPSAVVPLIRALIAMGNRDAALARAQELARNNPGSPPARLAYGDVLMLLGRPGEAAAEYKQAADLRFDQPAMLRLVEALDQAGQRADAANALALFLSQNPANATALRLSARWQLAGGDHDAAIDTLETLRARIGGRDAALNAELSAAYAAAGEWEAAERHGEAAYLLAPANPQAADAYGWALFHGGDPGGAVELLQKAVALAPRHSGLRWHLAQVYAELNRRPEARLHAEAALADPRFTDRAAASALLARMG